jgi:hypothetical protein
MYPSKDTSQAIIILNSPCFDKKPAKATNTLPGNGSPIASKKTPANTPINPRLLRISRILSNNLSPPSLLWLKIVLNICPTDLNYKLCDHLLSSKKSIIDNKIVNI